MDEPGYIPTYTDKAALQLQEELRTLLGYVTERTGQYYDLSNMDIGTIHSLCQRILSDRRFTPHRQRPKAPVLIDDLSQYLTLYRDRTWRELIASVGWVNANVKINNYLEKRN